jgi:hypothetical protein
MYKVERGQRWLPPPFFITEGTGSDQETLRGAAALKFLRGLSRMPGAISFTAHGILISLILGHLISLTLGHHGKSHAQAAPTL